MLFLRVAESNLVPGVVVRYGGDNISLVGLSWAMYHICRSSRS